MAELTGWGRTAPTAAHVQTAHSAEAVATAIRDAGPRGVLARGLGRSYGDAAQNAGGTVLDLTGLSSIGPVDPKTGEVTCGAGASLDALLRAAVPQGWFVPVTPGTRQVTLGGALAADVHGKNHHRDGTFSRHVTAVTLVDGRGEIHRLAAGDPRLRAVAGGMGLTGVVVALTVRLRAVESAWLTVNTERTVDLDATMAALERSDARTYSVAWLDCLARGRATGRGVVTGAEHAALTEVPGRAARVFQPRPRLRAPKRFPSRLLNARTTALFNEIYFRAAPSEPHTHRQHAAGYFHPLDVVADWNRLYGPRGFLQYQFVTPDAAVIPRALELLRGAHVPGLLSVLKRFGPGNDAPLSFPQPGWTLAVDIPCWVPGLGRLLDRLDILIAESGGRVYLAKDSRLRPELFEMMYPEADAWRELRALTDPDHRFTSDLARRLAL